MSTQQRPWSNTHVHRSAERRAQGQGATGGAHGAIPPIPYESREIERREGDGERCARAKTFSSFIKYFAISEHRGHRSRVSK